MKGLLALPPREAIPLDARKPGWRAPVKKQGAVGQLFLVILTPEASHVRTASILLDADPALWAFAHISCEEEAPQANHPFVSARAFVPWLLAAEAGVGAALVADQPDLVFLAGQGVLTFGGWAPDYMRISVNCACQPIL